MKRFFSWQITLGFLLVILSALVYLLHYYLFGDAHHIYIYLVGDIAFVFLEVLFVTLILHKLLEYRERKSLFKKLNMVIGAFFSEVGTELLKLLFEFDEEASKIANKLIIAIFIALVIDILKNIISAIRFEFKAYGIKEN